MLGLSFDKIKCFHIHDVFEWQNMIYYLLLDNSVASVLHSRSNIHVKQNVLQNITVVRW